MRGCSKGTVLSLLMGILSISLATDLSEELATVNLGRKQRSPLALAPWNYMDSKDWSEVWRSEPLGFWNKTGPTVLGTALSQPSSCFIVILVGLVMNVALLRTLLSCHFSVLFLGLPHPKSLCLALQRLEAGYEIQATPRQFLDAFFLPHEKWREGYFPYISQKLFQGLVRSYRQSTLRSSDEKSYGSLTCY